MSVALCISCFTTGYHSAGPSLQLGCCICGWRSFRCVTERHGLGGCSPLAACWDSAAFSPTSDTATWTLGTASRPLRSYLALCWDWPHHFSSLRVLPAPK